MNDTTSQHLKSLAAVGDLSSLPTHAEMARTLLGDGGYGTLTTTTAEKYPYGSLAAYSVLADGSPLVCISELAEHTIHARRNSAAGFFVAASTEGDPMDAPRVSLIGDLQITKPPGADIERHLRVHPTAGAYADWPDFAWWQLRVKSVRFVGGFGVMGWIDGAALAGAIVDPVAAASEAAVTHMNLDHADANLAIVRQLAGCPEVRSATVRDIDRFGMTFYADTPVGLRVARVPFPAGALSDPDQIRPAVVDLTHRAQALSQGFETA